MYVRQKKKHNEPHEAIIRVTRSKPKDKNDVTEKAKPRLRVTRSKNNFRLNSKSISKPSLKHTTVIDVDSDASEKPTKKRKVENNKEKRQCGKRNKKS